MIEVKDDKVYSLREYVDSRYVSMLGVAPGVSQFSWAGTERRQ